MSPIVFRQAPPIPHYFAMCGLKQHVKAQERMMTSLFFHGGGGRACDFVFSRGESRISRVY